MNLPLYDAHNHLQDERLAPDLPSIMIELERLPLRHAVVNGTRPQDWTAVSNLAQKHPWIIPSYGLHPWHVNHVCENWQTELAACLRNPAAAIGEVGLDHWIVGYDSAKQEAAFIWQLQLARKLKRPVTIHCLKAWGRLLEILKNEELPSGFLLHSYGGPTEMVPSFVGLGGYFSLSGYFAHERKERQRSVFRSIPLDRLLIETDAPDMTPPPTFQTSNFSRPGAENLNHPANIPAIYQFASDLYNIPIQRLTSIVEANFCKLFSPVLARPGMSPADNR